MSAGPTVADYLDAVRYRRYSRPVLLERRRLPGHALVSGDDARLASTPAAIASTVGARPGIDSGSRSGGSLEARFDRNEEAAPDLADGYGAEQFTFRDV